MGGRSTPDFDDVDVLGDFGGVFECFHELVSAAALIAVQRVENLSQSAVHTAIIDCMASYQQSTPTCMQGVVGSLVIVLGLLQIFSWYWNNFENRLIFGKIKAYKMVPFWASLYVQQCHNDIKLADYAHII